MKTKFIRSLIPALLAVVLVISVWPSISVNAAASPSLSVSGSQEVNSVITVNIKVSGTDGPYAGFSGGFSYDSSYLRLDSISQGNFTATFTSSLTSAFFTAYNGTIPSGTTIISAQFTCLKAGTTTIAL